MSLSEMLFLGLLGLVVFGPRKLSKVAQQAGRTLAQFKKASAELTSQLVSEVSADAALRGEEKSAPPQ